MPITIRRGGIAIENDENKKNRIAKADTETFLTDTETSLSRENADMLYSKINSELKKTRF